MSAQPFPQPNHGKEALLTPREVAKILGVRTATITRWSRAGQLTPLRTPGGHRRYRLADVRELLDEFERLQKKLDEDRAWAQDAVRLYEQGWSIRQVAARFDCSYGTMRRILKSRTLLRAEPGSAQVPHSTGQVVARRRIFRER